MFIRSRTLRLILNIAAFAIFTSLPAVALSQGNLDSRALRGAYVLSLDGTFSSAPPPFTGDVLPFEAAQVGRLVFDGAGLAWGEVTLTFHHPDIPFAVISRISLHGTYNVSPTGRAIISLDEFPIGVNGEPGSVRTNSVVFECYVVRRRLQSRCVLHTLISYQQGPEPRNLPVTMSGLLQRQY